MKRLTVTEMFEGFIISRPKYVALWELIDQFDKSHIELNYPYQTSEVKKILRMTYAILSTTKPTDYNREYLAMIKTTCDGIDPEKPDYMQINKLKDLVHHISEYGFPCKQDDMT